MSESRSIEELYAAARSGQRRALGRLLTRVERGGLDTDHISELVHSHTQGAHIIGITGPPGAGKSTLVGELVVELDSQGHSPAVLAVDPSSPLTGGAILGDRVRMEDGESNVFIRSMATRGHSGGLSLAVPLAVRLFDACGYSPIIIETVGVGQVEVDVVGAADTAIVVMMPGMGDAVQANKAGLLEVADVLVVNKADLPGASDARRDLDLMLDLSHLTGQELTSGYRPPIVMASALSGDGTKELWAKVVAHREHLTRSGLQASRRNDRIRAEVRARLLQSLSVSVDAMLEGAGARHLNEAHAAKISPTRASDEILTKILKDQS